MWYKIFVENEFAEYFMNNDSWQNSNDEETLDKMLSQYSEIVYAVAYTWVCKSLSIDVPVKALENARNCQIAFEYCYPHIRDSKVMQLSDIWNSIPHQNNESRYSVDVSLLSAEQCAVLIMYPFFSRMGGSFEKEFAKRGDMRKYLLALKEKIEVLK